MYESVNCSFLKEWSIGWGAALSYTVGETGRCFETRRKEHMRNVKSCARGSNIAKHAWSSNHSIDFNNSQVIDKGSYRFRKTLESWHTASIDHTDNNSRPLPNQYYCI